MDLAMAVVELANVSNHQTYIDHNIMESCYLETKWIILKNKTSNLIDGQQIGTFQEIVMAFKNK